MLCYIVYPDDLSQEELRSPQCLSRLKVQVIQFTSHLFSFAVKTEERMFIFSRQEIIVSRWVSSRERVEHDDA